MGAGFAAALVLFGALAPQLSQVAAGDGSSAIEFLLQQGRQRQHAGKAAGFFQAYAPSGFIERDLAPRHVSAKSAPAPRVRAASLSGGDSGSAGRRSVCVRLCDGYFFPVGDLQGDGEIAGHEAVCANQCPGAPTQLFIQPAGSDTIEDARSARGNKAYTALPVAFSHASRSENTCSCKAQQANHSVALLRDFTLRKGDSVATPLGIKVFRGAQHWPFKRNDFVNLAQAREINEQDRGALVALERAAKGLKPIVKATHKKTDAPAAAAPSVSRRGEDGRLVRVVGPQAFLSP